MIEEKDPTNPLAEFGAVKVVESKESTGEDPTNPLAEFGAVKVSGNPELKKKSNSNSSNTQLQPNSKSIDSNKPIDPTKAREDVFGTKGSVQSNPILNYLSKKGENFGVTKNNNGQTIRYDKKTQKVFQDPISGRAKVINKTNKEILQENKGKTPVFKKTNNVVDVPTIQTKGTDKLGNSFTDSTDILYDDRDKINQLKNLKYDRDQELADTISLWESTDEQFRALPYSQKINKANGLVKSTLQFEKEKAVELKSFNQSVIQKIADRGGKLPEYKNIKDGEKRDTRETDFLFPKINEYGFNVDDLDAYITDNSNVKEFYQRGVYTDENIPFFKGDDEINEDRTQHDTFKALKNYTQDRTSDLKYKANIYKTLSEGGNAEYLGKVNEINSKINSLQSSLENYKKDYFPIVYNTEKKKKEELASKFKKAKKGELSWSDTPMEFLGSGVNTFNNESVGLLTSVADAIGLNEIADQMRIDTDVSRFKEQKNLSVGGFYSGKRIKYNGESYIVTAEGRVIDEDTEKDVAPILGELNIDYNEVDRLAKQSNDVADGFSWKGATEQAGGVLGNLALQLVVGRGIGGGMATASKSLFGVSTIPNAMRVSNALSVGTTMYSTTSEQTLSELRAAGIKDSIAKDLANKSGLVNGAIGIATSTLLPDTELMSLFQSGYKKIVKDAVNKLATSGEQGFLKSLKDNFVSVVSAGAKGYGKELSEESIQQASQIAFNGTINEKIGKDVLQDSMTEDEWKNLAVQTAVMTPLAASSGLTKKDKLSVYNEIVNGNYDDVIKTIDEETTKGFYPKEKTDLLKRELELTRKYNKSVPPSISPEKRFDLFPLFEERDNLEQQKKNTDKAFHSEIDNKLNEINKRIEDVIVMEEQKAPIQPTQKDPFARETVSDRIQGKEELDTIDILANKVSEGVSTKEDELESLELQKNTFEKAGNQVELDRVNGLIDQINNGEIEKRINQLNNNETESTSQDKESTEGGIENTQETITQSTQENQPQSNGEIGARGNNNDGGNATSTNAREVLNNGGEISSPNLTKQQPTLKKVEPITNEEFLNFVDNDVVTDERLTDVATKITNNQELNKRENSIYQAKTKEIEQKINGIKNNSIISQDGRQQTTQEGTISIPQTAQRTASQTDREGNAGSTKIERIAKILKPRAKPQLKDPVLRSALNIEASSPYEEVLQYFVGGGSINPASIKELYGKAESSMVSGKSSVGEFRARIQLLKKESPSIKGLADQMWSSSQRTGNDGFAQNNSSDYREAIESILQSFNSRKQMANELLSLRGVDSDLEGELTEDELIQKQIDDYHNNPGNYSEKVESFDFHQETIIHLDELSDSDLSLLKKEQDEYKKVAAEVELSEYQQKTTNLKESYKEYVSAFRFDDIVTRQEFFNEIKERYYETYGEVAFEDVFYDDKKELLWKSEPANKESEALSNLRNSQGNKSDKPVLPNADTDNSSNANIQKQTEITPIGKGAFGNIYDQFKGKVKEAFDFLVKNKEGDLIGVFNRKEIGDIDLIWGDDKAGLNHIIQKYIEEQGDFKDIDEVREVIGDTIKNGKATKETKDKITIQSNGFKVVISRNVRNKKGELLGNKNWVVTAFDNSRSIKEKSLPTTTLVTPDSNKESRAVAFDSDNSSTANIQKQTELPPSFRNEFDRAKKDNDLKALNTLYDKVRVMLNGIAQKSGSVEVFESFKKEIEGYAKELKEKEAGSVGGDVNNLEGVDFDVFLGNTTLSAPVVGYDSEGDVLLDITIKSKKNAPFVFRFTEKKAKIGDYVYDSKQRFGFQVRKSVFDKLELKNKETNKKEKPILSSDSPELKFINKKIEDAEAELIRANDRVKDKIRELDKTIAEENEDLFGGRKSEKPNIFGETERVDLSQREKILAPLKVALQQAKDNLKDLKNKKEDLLSGNAESTSEIPFQKTKKPFKTIAPEQFKKLTDKLKKAFPNIKVNVVGSEKIKEVLGGNLGGVDFQMQEATNQAENIQLEYNEKGEHLAPNGKPSKLTEQQAKTTRTEAFKSWFGDWENDPKNASKVVDENGEPMVVYHGTGARFNEFDKKYFNTIEKRGDYVGEGFFFSKDKFTAEKYAKQSKGNNIIGAFLNIKNPLSPSKDFFSKMTDNELIDFFDTNPSLIRQDLINKGYTGLVDNNYNQYAVFEPNQIKLADGTNTTFNPNTNDIRYQQVAENDYKMSHSAPTKDDSPLHDMTGVYGDDIYTDKGWYYYGDGDRQMDKKSAAIIQSLRNKPNAKVKVYRAVPKGVGKINNGDWVSINKDYAKQHGENHLDGEYTILEQEVLASQVYYDGNSMHEQGVQFLKTPNGTIYGFVKDGQIYIDEDAGLNANTPIHEMSHVWVQMIKQQFPQAYKGIIEAVKREKALMDDKRKEKAYRNLTEEALADELLAELVGNKGEKDFLETLDKKKLPISQKLKQAIADFWKRVKAVFTKQSPNIKNWTMDQFQNAKIEDIVNNVTADLLSGKKVSDVSSEQLSKGTQFSQEDYKEGAKRVIREMFDKAKTNKTSLKNIPIGRLTNEGKKYLSNISGLDFKNFTDFILSPSELRHVYNDHFGENEKDKGNNIPLIESDIENMIEVISKPDRIVFLGYDKKAQSNKFTFLKKSDKGTYNLLEVYGNSGGKLTAKTFFNTKKDIEKRTNEIVKLLSTPDNDFGVLDQRAINTTPFVEGKTGVQSSLKSERAVPSVKTESFSETKTKFGTSETTFTDANIPPLIDFSKSEDVKFQVTAWHGSPHDIKDGFKTDKIGTGEGVQAFGWGLYFTDLESIARGYGVKKGEEQYVKIDGRLDKKLDGASYFIRYYWDGNKISTIKRLKKEKNTWNEDSQKDIKEAISIIQNSKYIETGDTPKNLYKVTLHKGKKPSEYNWLEWDKFAGEETINKIKDQYKKEGLYKEWLNYKDEIKSSFDQININSQSNGDIVYANLKSVLGGEKQASLFLLRAGIDGIKYPADSLSGNASKDNFNYVVFDENAVSIDEQVRFQNQAENKPFERKDPTPATKQNIQEKFLDAKVVQSENELPQAIQSEIKQQRAEGKIKGVFYNGEVYMVADNIKTLGEATGTYRHEKIGHKGVIDYLGNKLNTYTNGIIDKTTGNQLRRLQTLASRYNLPTDLSKLTAEQKKLLGEEYIAFVSENKAKFPNWWNEIARVVRSGLREMGIKLSVSDTEIQALIGKVEKNIKSKNDLSKNGNSSMFSINSPQAELDSIKEKAIANGSFMKAPNGKDTNLNEKQWLQTRTEAFKSWFGDWGKDPANASKVVDDNGEPMVVYHGTNAEFNEFKKGNIGRNHWQSKSNAFGGGFFFVDKKRFSFKLGIVKEVFLNIKNPTERKAQDYYYAVDMFDNNSSQFFKERFENKKDGIIINSSNGSLFIATSPNQIKSATDNVGAFDSNNNDIRFQINANDQINKLSKFAENKKGNEIFERISQDNNRAENKKNSRMEEVASKLRESLRAVKKELEGQGLRDYENKTTYDYANKNKLWVNSLYDLGISTGAGGTENTLAFDEKNRVVYKANNLFNSKFLISEYLNKLRLHNSLFPETAYELVGFTGLENKNGVPYVEPIAKQNFIKDSEQATEDEIKNYMESLGFTHAFADSFRKGDIVVHDLKPRNVLKDKDGDIYVVDAEFIEVANENVNNIRFQISEDPKREDLEIQNLKEEVKGLTDQVESIKQNLADITTFKSDISKFIDDTLKSKYNRYLRVSDMKAIIRGLASVNNKQQALQVLEQVDKVINNLYDRKARNESIFNSRSIYKAINTILSINEDGKARASEETLIQTLKEMYDISDNVAINLITNAKRQDRYVAPPRPRKGQAITVADIPNEIEKKKESLARRLNKKRQEWFSNYKGDLMKEILPMKDMMQGNIKLMVNNAQILDRKMKADAKKLGFTNWDLFDKTMRGENDGKLMPELMQQYAKDFRLTIDGLTRNLILNGYVSPDIAITLEENMGKYIKRSYKVFEDNGYAKKLQKNSDPTIKKARQDLYNRFFSEEYTALINAGESETRAKDTANARATHRINEIIAELTDEFKPEKKNNISNVYGALKQRKEVPEEYRALLGEYTDPSTNFLITVSELASMNSQRNYLSSLREMGLSNGLFFEKNDPNIPPDFTEVIASNETWKPLDGLYTSPELKKYIFEEQGNMQITGPFKYLAWLINGVKYGKTILSPQTHAINLLSNGFIEIMNGTIIPNTGSKDSFKYSINQAFGDKNYRSELTDLAMKYNLIGQSVKKGELDTALNVQEDFTKDIFNQANRSKAVNFMVNLAKKPQEFYGIEDDVFKIHALSAEMNRYARSEFNKSFEQLTETEKEYIGKKASEIVKQTRPNYSRVWKGAKYLNQNTLVIGNFLSFQAESMRILLNSTKIAMDDLKSENNRRAGLERLAGVMLYTGGKTAFYSGLGVMAGGITGVALKALGGMDDEEEGMMNDINRAVAGYYKVYDKKVEYKGNGKYQVYNVNTLEPYNVFNITNAYTNGNEKFPDGGVGAVAHELLSPFLGEDMTAATLFSVYANKDEYKREIYNETDFLGNQVADIMLYAWKKLAPGFVGLMYKAYNEDDKKGLAMSFLGLKNYELDVPKVLGFKIRDYKKQLTSINSDNFNNDRKYKNKEISKEEYKAEVEGIEAREKVILDKVKSDRESAIRLGVPVREVDAQIRELKKPIFRGTGVDRKDLDYIKKGN